MEYLLLFGFRLTVLLCLGLPIVCLSGIWSLLLWDGAAFIISLEMIKSIKMPK